MKFSESTDSHLLDDLRKENEKLRRQLQDQNAGYTRQKNKDDKVLENEQRLQAIFDHAAIGIVEVDIEDRFVNVNHKVCEILGYSKKELLTKTVSDITAPEDLVRSNELNAKLNNGEFDIFAYEKRYITRDGIPIWVYVTVSAIRDANGRFLRAIGTVENISERKKVELKLQERANEIEAILSCIADGVIVYDREGRIVRSNAAVDAIIRIGERDRDLTLSERASLGSELFTENGDKVALDEMPANRAFMYAETIKNQVYFIQGLAEPRWVSISAAPLIVSGQHAGGVVSMSDITVRRQAIAALRESEEKFRSLFENITEGVALHEMIYENNIPVNYRFLDSNPAYREYTGIDTNTDQEILATDIYGKEHIPNFQEYATVAETRQPYRFETFFPDMNRNFIIHVISPKRGQFATVYEDITEQKRIEQEINQKNEELTRFIYTISHDLKSPLVTIQAFTSYLGEDILNGDKDAQNRDINYVQNAADKMGKLLDELLELSRIGRKEKAKAEIPLKTVVDAARDLVAGRLDKNRIRIQFTGPPVMLYGHAQRFIQLYQNLIDNAAKFIGNQPEPLIEIGSYQDKEKNNAIILFVRDNGSGIDPRYSHKVFGLFEKLDNSTEGTGIGLALVRRIIEVHGGSVWFVSEGEGKGTTFYFTLEGTRLIK